MPHQSGKTCQCTAFHFEVGDAKVAVAEGHDLVVGLRIGEGHAQTATLRPVEATAGDGDAAYHVGARHAVEQLGVVVDAIGVGDALRARPVHGFEEGALKLEVANFVAARIEVEQSVETETLLRGDESALGRVALQASAGADAH